MSVLAAVSRYVRCQTGATAIEYGLIAAMIAMVLVPGLLWLKGWQSEVAQKINAQLDPAAAAVIMIDARRDFREPPRDARDHQG
jgi:Flp pilus assembly pilin Flp